MSEWIRVEEKLPERGEIVLVYSPGGDIYHPMHMDHICIATLEVRKWGVYEGKLIAVGAELGTESGGYEGTVANLDDVTHWMPLPLPPESTESD